MYFKNIITNLQKNKTKLRLLVAIVIVALILLVLFVFNNSYRNSYRNTYRNSYGFGNENFESDSNNINISKDSLFSSTVTVEL